MERNRTFVADRTVDRPASHADHVLAGIVVGVELGEVAPVLTVGGGRKATVAGLPFALFESRQPFEDVARPADRLAEFAVVDDVDADICLLPDHRGNGACGAIREHILGNRSAVPPCFQKRQQFRRANEAPNMRRENSPWATRHVQLLPTRIFVELNLTTHVKSTTIRCQHNPRIRRPAKPEAAPVA